MDTPIFLALLGSLVTILSTSLGALPALAARRVSERTQDTLMGFSAGIMLAAASFSLINPALRLTAESSGRVNGSLQVGAFMLGGALFLHLCNRFIPHEHFSTGREGGPSQIQLKRIWLFVFAITLHNFPEGLAVGTGVGSQSLKLALPILVGIGLQDLPEGFVVAMALLTVGYSSRQAIGVAVLTGLVEGFAALLGYWAVVEVRSILPWALALAGGAMLYVVSDEMIPESHHKEHAKYATGGLMVGFVLMMILDSALG
ncbi:MAG: ZIP family metal transporter [Bacteriovoracia bacterium]